MHEPSRPGTPGWRRIVAAYWVTQLMGAAARLGVADQLEPEPRQVNDLAARVGAHPQALYRTLRACTAVGVFTEQAGQTFANNALSQTLRSNVPGSMRDFAIARSLAALGASYAGRQDRQELRQRGTGV